MLAEKLTERRQRDETGEGGRGDRCVAKNSTKTGGGVTERTRG